MTGFDIFISVIIVFFAIKGMFKGAVNESINLFIIFIALFIIPIFAENSGIFMAKALNFDISNEIMYFFGYLILIIGFLLLGFIVSIITHFILKATGLSIIDRCLGLIVGAFKAAIILTLLLNLGLKFDVTKPFLEKVEKTSKYLPHAVKFGNILIGNAEKIKSKIQKEKPVIENQAKKIGVTILKDPMIKKATDIIKDKDNQKDLINTIDKNLDKSINILDSHINNTISKNKK